MVHLYDALEIGMFEEQNPDVLTHPSSVRGDQISATNQKVLVLYVYLIVLCFPAA